MNSQRMLDRAWVLAGLWVVQFAAFYAAPMLLVALNDGTPASMGDFFSLDYALFGLTCATVLSAVQGAFLIPIRPPGKGNGRPGMPRVIALAACLSVVIGGVAAYVFMIVDSTGLLSTNSDRVVAVFWITAASLLPPLFAFLVWKLRRGIPVGVSMAMAALLAGGILAGLALGIAGLIRLITDNDTPNWAWYWILLPSPLVGWAVFTPLIIAFVRNGAPEAGLSRLAARLLVGTTIEAVAVIPVQMMVRRKSQCYCDEASFWSLVASLSVGFVTLGPAVYLLVWKRYQLRFVEGHCRACGYDMRGTPKAQRCPECGVGWADETANRPDSEPKSEAVPR